MLRPLLVAVVGLVLSRPVAADNLDPDQAGQEARDSLKELLGKQSRDRDAREQKPAPTKPETSPPTRGPDPVGGNLPAICIGCEAR